MELHTIQACAYAIFPLLGISIIIGIFKAIDWAMSQKYVDTVKCERCRADIYKTIATDHTLLVSLNTKIDLVLNAINLDN